MTETFLHQNSDTRIFCLSAVGSMFLHGVLMAGLAYMPQSTIVKNESPTVQITLLPAPKFAQTSQASTPPLQPRMATPRRPSPPIPLTPAPRSQPSAPPLQASLKPPTRLKPSPLTPPQPTKTILNDVRAAQAMKARNMMKMRVSPHARQIAPALPNVNTRNNPVNHVMAPIPTVRKGRSAARPFLAPPTLESPRTLTATVPAQTRSTMTRPTIIASSRPVYPRVARESGWEGTVIVRTLIDTSGVPSQVKIRKSCGHLTLDQAAQDAVQRWTFQPAKDGNIPITKWVDVPIKFDLNS